MGKVKVAGFSISLDGYGAGPEQALQNPLGVGGEGLHTWLVETDAFVKMHGKGEGTKGKDNDIAA